MDLLPDVPQWALAAGLPEPAPEESFVEYVQRLGLDPEPLLVGLNERTLVLANQRLSSLLMRLRPDDFRRYVDARRAVYHPGK